MVPGSNYEFAQVQIPEGVNQLVNPEGFIAYAYGSGQIESYGFVVGTGVESIQFETDTKYPFEVIGEKVACLDQLGTWEISPENKTYTEFIWSFGDNTPVAVGKKSLTFSENRENLLSQSSLQPVKDFVISRRHFALKWK